MPMYRMGGSWVDGQRIVPLEVALPAGQKVYFEGAGGDSYIWYDVANARIAISVDGTDRCWFSTNGVLANGNLRGSSDNLRNLGTTAARWKDLFLGEKVEMAEMAEPGVAPANRAHLFCKDNGAGKTQFCIRFQSGASIVLATEV